MSVLLRIFICLSGLALIYMARKANIVRKMTERQSLFWIMGGKDGGEISKGKRKNT